MMTGYLLFTSILLTSSFLVLVDNNNRISKAIASWSTALESKHFLTVEKPTLGFKISYPYNWNIIDNDFLITFKAPQNAATVTFSISNLTSYSRANLTLEQYSSNEINNIKSVESKKAGNVIKFLESKPHLLSGQPGYGIVFLT